jgi:FkbM family methyltransferase
MTDALHHDAWQPESRLGQLVTAYARRAPEHPAKLRIVHWLTRRLTCTLRHPSGGRLDFIRGEYLSWALLVHGTFEAHSLALAIRLMRNGGTLVDVGANLGFYAIAVTAATGCRAIGIEPEPTTFGRLQRNLGLNRDLNIVAVNCAATPIEMEVGLQLAGVGREAWTAVTQPGGEHTIAVAGRPLELILREAGFEAVTLLKIDVEGYEVEALRGLDWEGPRRPRHVIMECSPTSTTKLTFMRERGYEARSIMGGPLTDRDTAPEGNVHFASRV